MSPRKSINGKLSVPEKCQPCPVFRDAQADADVNERMCHFGLVTPEQITAPRKALQEAGYDIPSSDEESLARLRGRMTRCLGAVTLEKTVDGVKYEVTVCGSTDATIPRYHQDILFEPATVQRTAEK